MNTTGYLSAVAGVLIAVVTALGTLLVRKGDRRARMDNRYFDEADHNMDVLNAARGDYWKLFGWAAIVLSKWNVLRESMRHERDIGELPAIPEPTHTQLHRPQRDGADDET